MNSSLPLSVVLISFNEEQNIGRTLEAVKEISSEIVVVDSHSTDNTVKIAEGYGAKVFTEDWKGHVAQKNSALEKCSCEWILSLDCDELPEPELVESIKHVVEKPTSDGYMLNRRTFYMGKFLKYSWQPDWKLRLFRKDSSPKWGGYDPHDKLSINGSVEKIDNGDLLHYSYKDIYDHYQRLVKYSKLAAQSYFDDGKRFSYGAVLTKPLFAFVKKYFIKLGFMDGFAGFAVALSSFIYVYLKYLFLKEIQEKENG
ncbi:MAG: glycosyltransferase family 2 protein [Denitrovibrio sp.]|nr:MAG: glycosyltransferase family 2 protein [Denitrovibrio sp.]